MDRGCSGDDSSQLITTVAANIRRDERFKIFSDLSLEVFAFILRFLPFSNFLMCLCTCRTFRSLPDQDSLTLGIWESFKFTLKFVYDSDVFSNACRLSMSNRLRFEELLTVYREYFGGKDIHRRNVRIRFNRLFPVPAMIRKARFDEGYLSGFLLKWLFRSFAPMRNLATFDTFFPGVPLSCISTLRYAGIFSTFRTRRAFVECLTCIISSPRFDHPKYFRLRVMLNFLIQLTNESFSLSAFPADSLEFQSGGDIMGIRHRVVDYVLMDVYQRDFAVLEERFSMLYGRNFLGVRFLFP